MPQQVMGNRTGKLIRVDFHVPDTRLIVEVLGYRHHRTKLQMQIDAERVNRLTLAGYLVLQFTYDHVVTTPDWVAEQVAAALSLSRAA
jgi:very-short-patch-repair endonuclease